MAFNVEVFVKEAEAYLNSDVHKRYVAFRDAGPPPLYQGPPRTLEEILETGMKSFKSPEAQANLKAICEAPFPQF